MSFISYAQNGEDVLLWRALGHIPGGFYIDVGASDPVADSVTKVFYDAGWHGINIEPLPAMHRALQAQRPRDINLALAAGARESVITLFEVPAMNGWASPDPAVAAAHRAEGLEVAELNVPMRTLSGICAQYAPADIHFLKVDVEGYEGEVLRGFDLRRWRPWVLVIEATVPNSRVGSHADWEALVTGRGYRHAWFDGLNRYYVADEHAGLAAALALQPNVFDDVVSYHLDSARKAGAAWRAEAELAAELARQSASDLCAAQTENNALQAALAQLRGEADTRSRHTLALQAWAGELERDLLATRRSTSWRVTAPLRLAGSIPKRGARATQRARAALRRAVLRASASERLRRLFVPVLLRFPGHAARVARLLADLRHPAAVPDPPAAVPDLPAELRAMPARARRVLDDLRRARSGAAYRRAHGLRDRPRLAYVSPLPPQRSGIADYSAMLIPELVRRYDIELIVVQDTIDDPRLAAFPVRTPDWFEHNAQHYDRVLYHFGNSQAHQYMFALIRRHPGVVVLHDFFLSGVLDSLAREGVPGGAFLEALYRSHGYTALREHAVIGRDAAVWKYPLNKEVLDNASGVIVHSDFSRELARAWYGPDAGGDWRCIALLRAAPASARGDARARLGLASADYLVCSFGMLGRTKLNDELLDAFLASPLADDLRCKLVFVGQNDGGLYGLALAKKIAASGAARRIRVTGFVTPARYADYLSACDTAVQLRTATRGETSASLLDCLLHGVPTIANAHGAAGALDPALLIKLPDSFGTAQLADALAGLRADPQRRAAMARRARACLQAEHAPAHVGRLYADAIEHFALHSGWSRYQRLVEEMARNPGRAPDAQLADIAQSGAFDQGGGAPRQLLVDVSAVAANDLRTGIQRVVRSVLLALIAEPPPGWRIEPVFGTGANRPYRYARGFTLGFLGLDGPLLEDAPVDLHPGDAFLGLDLFTNGTAQNAALLASMRARGVNVYFVVFDLLPVLRPEFFPFGAGQYFGEFLRTVSAVSDGLLCISRSVADELIAWIGAAGIARQAPLQVGYFHLGADIDASAPSAGLPDDAGRVFAAIAARPSFLMVGTVEPRKGHAQALAAFELLWRDGIDVNLVIVGKQGWMVDQLAARMSAHPERERRLFWLADVSDEMLQGLYRRCAALLAASEGEGFGLPLIEAAQHGIAVIARALPVFREVAGAHAHYFSGLEADDLAAALRQWMALQREGKAPLSSGMPWLTWQESARRLLDAVVRQKWYRQVPQKSHN